MSNYIKTVCDAVATAIEDGSYSQSVDVAVRYAANFTIEDRAADALVTVVPESVELTKNSRAHNRHQLTVNVVIHKKVGSTANDTDIEAMLLLTEEILDTIAFGTFSGSPVLQTRHDPVMDQETLQTTHVYVSVVQLVVAVDREV
jgi:hypothetical protein